MVLDFKFLCVLRVPLCVHCGPNFKVDNWSRRTPRITENTKVETIGKTTNKFE